MLFVAPTLFTELHHRLTCAQNRAIKSIPCTSAHFSIRSLISWLQQPCASTQSRVLLERAGLGAISPDQRVAEIKLLRLKDGAAQKLWGKSPQY
jgi:hypothetical protein